MRRALKLGKRDKLHYTIRPDGSVQYRLFFRFHLESRIIVYAWLNDADSKRV